MLTGLAQTARGVWLLVGRLRKLRFSVRLTRGRLSTCLNTWAQFLSGTVRKSLAKHWLLVPACAGMCEAMDPLSRDGLSFYRPWAQFRKNALQSCALIVPIIMLWSPWTLVIGLVRVVRKVVVLVLAARLSLHRLPTAAWPTGTGSCWLFIRVRI